MNIAALFAGIGGLELGLQRAGHRTAMSCEIWEPARAVLRSRFPDVEQHADVCTLPALPPDVDLVTAGFPCQDLSQAGSTAGIDGRRSGLVDHVFRLLDGRRVPLVLLENVSFMLQLNKGAAMDVLTKAFEERGYRWAYRTVNSLAYLPQRRQRVFFLASACDLAPEDVLFVDDAEPRPPSTQLDTHAHGFYWTEGIRGLGWAPDAVPTLKNGSTVGIPSPPAILMPSGAIIKPDIRDAERLQGLPEDWTALAPSRLRWSLVGNAVTAPVAAWLGKRLLDPGAYGGDADVLWPSKSGSFPRAARFDGRRRFAVAAGPFPEWEPRPPLHEFLAFEGELLSGRATEGFLRRTDTSSLRFAPGFLDAVRAHLNTMREEEWRRPEPRTPRVRKSAADTMAGALIAAE